MTLRLKDGIVEGIDATIASQRSVIQVAAAPPNNHVTVEELFEAIFLYVVHTKVDRREK
jgi:hypothetical protein